MLQLCSVSSVFIKPVQFARVLKNGCAGRCLVVCVSLCVYQQLKELLNFPTSWFSLKTPFDDVIHGPSLETQITRQLSPTDIHNYTVSEINVLRGARPDGQRGKSKDEKGRLFDLNVIMLTQQYKQQKEKCSRMLALMSLSGLSPSLNEKPPSPIKLLFGKNRRINQTFLVTKWLIVF